MDTRIGYPNEHLAPTTVVDNITSPMYSTGIGLVIKGFTSTLSSAKTRIESETAAKNHSTKTKGNFFEKILTKSRTWFEEED